MSELSRAFCKQKISRLLIAKSKEEFDQAHIQMAFNMVHFQDLKKTQSGTL